MVSIKEIQSSQSLFTLSPNPTSEILNLKSEQLILFPLAILIMDMQGKLITQKIIHNNDDLSLNVKSFVNGEYLIAIKNGCRFFDSRQFNCKKIKIVSRK